jgi:hypothetical protein
VLTYSISRPLFADTFRQLRECGQGRNECQVLWISPWAAPEVITAVVHPKHSVHSFGFEVESAWVSSFWKQLATESAGIRCQIHTHPGRAYHSRTDDNWPVIHTAGFFSLVIPNLAMGEATFDGSYLAELQQDGTWCEVCSCERIKLI